jgi:DeoR/GlpR family transcriptional regulator of sugar metabolism
VSAPAARLNASRRRWLQDQLAVHGTVVATDAAAQLGVSVDSIRRDLNVLADQGLLRRVHGGAVAVADPDARINSPHVIAPPPDAAMKRAMADAVLSLVPAGSVVALDAGTTSEEIARRWPYGHAATIVTTSPIVASALVGRSDVTVICVGGVLDPVWGACTGPAAVSALAGFRFDVAVVGVCGLDATGDATTSSLHEVDAKRQMVEGTTVVVVPATPDKLATTAPYVICATRSIDAVVVSPATNKALRAAIRRAGPTVVIAR